MEGAALADEREVDIGIARIRQGVTALRATALQTGWPYYLARLTEAHAHRGALDEALTVQAEAVAIAERTGERCWDAELARLKGELLLRRAKADEAEAEVCFRKAIDVARGQDAKSWELRAAMSLARLLEKRGDHEGARRQLAEVYGWLTEGFETADLLDAKALLAQLERRA